MGDKNLKHIIMNKVLIVEDHSVVRMGLNLLIHELYQKVTVIEGETFFEALELLREHQFDLIILDINIDGSEGTKMISIIRSTAENVAILIFSACDEEKYALRYIQAGASGFLSKKASRMDLIAALRAIEKGEKYVSNIIGQQMLNAVSDRLSISRVSNWKNLSEREHEIAQLLVQGKWTGEIAGLLNLKASTISTFKRRIFEKFDVTNITELVKKFGNSDY